MIKEEQNLSVCEFVIIPCHFLAALVSMRSLVGVTTGRHRLHPKIVSLMIPFPGTQQFDQR